jgi:hypothetical protein
MTPIGAYGNFSHGSWSPDWGLVNFTYAFNYSGDAISGYEAGMHYEAVEAHDFYAYKTPAMVILPSAIGNGDCMIYRVEMLDKYDNVVDYLRSSNFQGGTIRGFILPGGTLHYFTRRSYDWLQVFASDVYRVKATTYFSLPSDQWFPSGPWYDSATSNTF